MSEQPDVRIETVRRLDLKAGEILHITLGVEDLGDGQGPWIPGLEELARTYDEWSRAVPPGVAVIVTHFGERPEVINAEVLRAQVEAERRAKRAEGYDEFFTRTVPR